MATQKELTQMVQSFRVSELQVLLGYAGRSKAGKKNDLMQRSLHLVEKGCSTPLQIKIRELYKRRFPTGGPSGKSGSPAAASASPKSSASHGGDSQFSRGDIASGQPPGYASGYADKKEVKEEDNTKGAALDFCTRGSNQIPVHPDVRFKPLPFYDKLGELLKPSSLMPRNSSRFQDTFFIFHLTPQQAADISMSRTLSHHGIEDYGVQVLLRFCLLETSCEQKDEFPPSISVRVNSKAAPLPNPIPTNKQGVEPKRPSRPVNITHICHLSPTASNHINISWASELGRSYCVCVDLVRKLDSNILLQRTKARGTKHPDFTTALIKEKLAPNPDFEITTTSLRCSLRCPLGKMRMSVPGRALTCNNHVQCFDLPTFLQMNEKKPTWMCPVCDRPAELKELIVDGLFTQILRTVSDASEIEFKEDGSWAPSGERDLRDRSLSSSPETVQMIGEEKPGSSSSSSSRPAVSSATGGGDAGGSNGPATAGGGAGAVIDLTEFDDEVPEPSTMTLSNETSSSDDSGSDTDDGMRGGSREAEERRSARCVLGSSPLSPASGVSCAGSRGGGGGGKDELDLLLQSALTPPRVISLDESSTSLSIQTTFSSPHRLSANCSPASAGSSRAACSPPRRKARRGSPTPTPRSPSPRHRSPLSLSPYSSPARVHTPGASSYTSSHAAHTPSSFPRSPYASSSQAHTPQSTPRSPYSVSPRVTSRSSPSPSHPFPTFPPVSYGPPFNFNLSDLSSLASPFFPPPPAHSRPTPPPLLNPFLFPPFYRRTEPSVDLENIWSILNDNTTNHLSSQSLRYSPPLPSFPSLPIHTTAPSFSSPLFAPSAPVYDAGYAMPLLTTRDEDQRPETEGRGAEGEEAWRRGDSGEEERGVGRERGREQEGEEAWRRGTEGEGEEMWRRGDSGEEGRGVGRERGREQEEDMDSNPAPLPLPSFSPAPSSPDLSSQLPYLPSSPE